MQDQVEIRTILMDEWRVYANHTVGSICWTLAMASLQMKASQWYGVASFLFVTSMIADRFRRVSIAGSEGPRSFKQRLAEISYGWPFFLGWLFLGAVAFGFIRSGR